MRRLHRHAAEGVVGRRGDGRERLLLRPPAAHRRRPLRTTRCCAGMVDGDGQGLLRHGREPGRRLGQRRAATARRCANLDWLVVRDLVEIETAAFWYDARRSRRGELRPEDIGTEVFFLPGRRAHREGRHLHQHPAAAAVARQGGRAAAATAARSCGSSTTSAAACASKLAGSTDAARPRRARPDLGLPDRGRRTTSPTPRRCCSEINGVDGRRARRVPDVPGAARTTARPRAAAGSTPASTPTASTRPRGASPAASRPGSRPSGAGRGRRTAASSTTAPRPTRTGRPWSERKRYVWWDAEQGKWTGERRPRLQARQGARLRAARGRARAWTRSAATSRSSCSPTARLALRARRPRRRPAADALRAARVAVRQPALRRAAVQPGAPADPPPREPLQPDARRARRRGVPVRGDHLPAHRAPHRRRHVALAALPGRAAARDVLRGLAGARARARARARRLGDDRDHAHGDRGARAGHRADAPLRVGGRAGPPGRPALPLGLARARHRRRGQRAARRSRSTPTSTSPSTRRRPATSARPPAARARRCAELVDDYRRRAAGEGA